MANSGQMGLSSPLYQNASSLSRIPGGGNLHGGGGGLASPAYSPNALKSPQVGTGGLMMLHNQAMGGCQSPAY